MQSQKFVRDNCSDDLPVSEIADQFLIGVEEVEFRKLVAMYPANVAENSVI